MDKNLAQSLTETKLYCPLKFMIETEDGGDLCEAYPEDYMQYADAINAKIMDDLIIDEDSAKRGLAAYLDDSPLDKKTCSITPKVEIRNGSMYGAAVIKSYGELNKDELSELTEYISGQFSDGWGEGFEQREVRLSDENVYISFWDCDDDYFLKPESDVFPEQGLNQ